jgi:hypothetical protein
MTSEFDPEKARSDFLIAMYNQLMNDINRHIVVVWQSVGVLFGAFALFALVEKQFSLDVATLLIILLCAWVIAHVQDASYWYNRNLVIIANIERQFLRPSDLREIHYYFGAHRRSGAMITRLRIQVWLSVAVAALVLLIHFVTNVIPVYQHTKEGTGLTALPWVVALFGAIWWRYWYDRAKSRYENFLRNSPGKPVETDDIQHGPGHPV